MNKCIFVGNLTRDPELTTTPNGVSVCRFSIAVNRTYTNANGEREADIINIVAWRGLGENCAKYLAKGRKVCVCGSLQTRSYDDKDGNKRYVSEIVAEDVEFINSASQQGDAAERPAPVKTASSSTRKPSGGFEPIDDDGELPF